jgi:hypothetical protein
VSHLNVNIPYSDNYEPGTWKGLQMPDGQRSALITCSRGHTGILINHTISDDGGVSPSVACSERGCDFHEWVTLEGWVGAEGKG